MRVFFDVVSVSKGLVLQVLSHFVSRDVDCFPRCTYLSRDVDDSFE